jgi:hypothetical protein
MSLEQKPVRPILVDFRCDECPIGFYRPTGSSNYNPHKGETRYTHKCTSCGGTREFIHQYPVIRYVEEGCLWVNENEFKEDI